MRLVTVVSVVLAGLLTLLAVVAAVATRIPSLQQPVRAAVVVAEGVVVLFVVADLGLVLRGGGEGSDSLVTHLGYAVAAAGLVPALVWRAPAGDEAVEDVEPASLWVVAVVLLAVAVCALRLAATR